MLTYVPSGRAAWRWVGEKDGFFGEYALGANYSWSDDLHFAELTFGQNRNVNGTFYQLNAGYRYSPWLVPVDKYIWAPLQPGVFIVGALGEGRFFIRSPDNYPYPGYYDQTALRMAFQFSSELRLNQDFAIAYDLVMLDYTIVALLNNIGARLDYYFSSGLSIYYRFK